MSSNNLIMYWSGSTLGTHRSSPDRPTFDTLLKLKGKNPDWIIHIITHSGCLPDDDAALILAEQTATLTEAGIVVLDAAKPFSKLRFNEDLEIFYRQAISEGEGTLAHVFGSDICRVAMLERFKGQNILYMDVDVKATTPLSSLTRPHSKGVIIAGQLERDGSTQVNNNIFYIDSEFLGQQFLNLIGSYLLANLVAHDSIVNGKLFKPNKKDVFNYVLSLTGPHLWHKALYKFAYVLKIHSSIILDCRHSISGVLVDILRLNDLKSNTHSTWAPKERKNTEGAIVDIPSNVFETADENICKAVEALAEHIEKSKKTDKKLNGDPSRFDHDHTRPPPMPFFDSRTTVPATDAEKHLMMSTSKKRAPKQNSKICCVIS